MALFIFPAFFCSPTPPELWQDPGSRLSPNSIYVFLFLSKLCAVKSKGNEISLAATDLSQHSTRGASRRSIFSTISICHNRSIRIHNSASWCIQFFQVQHDFSFSHGHFVVDLRSMNYSCCGDFPTPFLFPPHAYTMTLYCIKSVCLVIRYPPTITTTLNCSYQGSTVYLIILFCLPLTDFQFQSMPTWITAPSLPNSFLFSLKSPQMGLSDPWLHKENISGWKCVERIH